MSGLWQNIITDVTEDKWRPLLLSLVLPACVFLCLRNVKKNNRHFKAEQIIKRAVKTRRWRLDVNGKKNNLMTDTSSTYKAMLRDAVLVGLAECRPPGTYYETLVRNLTNSQQNSGLKYWHTSPTISRLRLDSTSVDPLDYYWVNSEIIFWKTLNFLLPSISLHLNQMALRW